MRQSALVHLLEKTYNDFEEKYFDSKEVSKRLLLEFANLAQRNDIRFVVAGIEQEGRGMLKDLAREGIATVDISVDLEVEGNRNMPHDGHPSFKAHQAYARRLFALIAGSGLEY